MENICIGIDIEVLICSCKVDTVAMLNMCKEHCDRGTGMFMWNKHSCNA